MFSILEFYLRLLLKMELLQSTTALLASWIDKQIMSFNVSYFNAILFLALEISCMQHMITVTVCDIFKILKFKSFI